MGRIRPPFLPTFGEASDEDVVSVEIREVATASRAKADEEDAIRDCAGAMDCAFEGDGDVRSGVGVVGADAGWIDGSAGSEAEGSGQLEGQAAFEFGGAEDSVLGAAFKGDKGTAVQVTTLRNEVKVRTRAPRSDAPFQAGAFIGAFPGGARGRIGTGHEADVLFLGIANGSGNEIEQMALPEVGPTVDGEQIHRGGAKTVGANGREHTCASGVPTVPDVVAVA